jgi:hypothetical protein
LTSSAKAAKPILGSFRLSLWVTLRMRSVGWDTHIKWERQKNNNNLILYNNLLNILAFSGPLFFFLKLFLHEIFNNMAGGLYYKTFLFYFLLHIHIFPLLMIMLYTFFVHTHIFYQAIRSLEFSLNIQHYTPLMKRSPISTCRYI